MGYIPYKNPYFKLFLYAGYVNHFNTKIIVAIDGGPTFKVRPKEDNIAVYQAIARFGASVDLAMFNLDFNYSISLNSATTTSFRTSWIDSPGCSPGCGRACTYPTGPSRA